MFEKLLAEIVDQEVIDNCECNGACDAGLNWLRAKPRTFGDLRGKDSSWWEWLSRNISLPAVLEKLAGDSDAYVRSGVAKNPNALPAVSRAK